MACRERGRVAGTQLQPRPTQSYDLLTSFYDDSRREISISRTASAGATPLWRPTQICVHYHTNLSEHAFLQNIYIYLWRAGIDTYIKIKNIINRSISFFLSQSATRRRIELQEKAWTDRSQNLSGWVTNHLGYNGVKKNIIKKYLKKSL